MPVFSIIRLTKKSRGATFDIAHFSGFSGGAIPGAIPKELERSASMIRITAKRVERFLTANGIRYG